MGYKGFYSVFPGVPRFYGDPRLCCKTPLGFSNSRSCFFDGNLLGF